MMDARTGHAEVPRKQAQSEDFQSLYDKPLGAQRDGLTWCHGELVYKSGGCARSLTTVFNTVRQI